MSLDGLLGPKDVAARLNVSYTTVMSYIKDGKLKAFKRGGRWKIREENLESFALERKTKEDRCTDEFSS